MTNFTWTVDNYSKLNTSKHYSSVFSSGGCKWRLFMFPKGNNVDCLSLYLELADSASLPFGWGANVLFSFLVVDQIHNEHSTRKESVHQFDARQSSWGFTSFMPLDDLNNSCKGYILNDTVIVKAHIAVHKVCDSWSHNSTKETSCEQEKEEQRSHKAQTDTYIMIKVARDEDLKEQIGRDIYFDLVDHDKVPSFCIRENTPFKSFKDEVAKRFGIPLQFQQFWFWAQRVNGTYRPHQRLTVRDEARLVGQFPAVTREERNNNRELKLFLEVEFGLDLRPIAPPQKTKEDILLFCKLYDPVKGQLRYVGRLFVKCYGRPVEILSTLKQMANFATDEEIELYEEIRFEPKVMCISIDMMDSFQGSQIESGDIICFQKSLQNEEKCQYPDVCSFLEHVHHKEDKTRYAYQLGEAINSKPESVSATVALDAEPLVQTLEGYETHSESKVIEAHPSPEIIPFELSNSQKIQNLAEPDTPTDVKHALVAAQSSDVQMVTKNLLEELSRLSVKQSALSGAISDCAPCPETLRQKREALEGFFSLSLEAIHKANRFDNIEKIALVLVHHSASSLERTILKDLMSRLACFRETIPGIMSIIETVQADRSSLSGKSTNLSARLNQRNELLTSLEGKYSELLEEEGNLEAEIKHLIAQKEKLFASKTSMALELEKTNQEVYEDLQEWRKLEQKTEQADNKWLQAREKLAQANLSWKLFKQNLELCNKPA